MINERAVENTTRLIVEAQRRGARVCGGGGGGGGGGVLCGSEGEPGEHTARSLQSQRQSDDRQTDANTRTQERVGVTGNDCCSVAADACLCTDFGWWHEASAGRQLLLPNAHCRC